MRYGHEDTSKIRSWFSRVYFLPKYITFAGQPYTVCSKHLLKKQKTFPALIQSDQLTKCTDLWWVQYWQLCSEHCGLKTQHPYNTIQYNTVIYNALKVEDRI